MAAGDSKTAGDLRTENWEATQKSPSGPNASYHIARAIADHLDAVERLRKLEHIFSGHQPPEIHEAVIQSLRRDERFR